MSAIYDALSHLNDRLIVLEQTIDLPVKKIQTLSEKLQEKKRFDRAGQPDLFAAPVLDKAALTRKLDLAIERVEQVLQEA